MEPGDVCAQLYRQGGKTWGTSLISAAYITALGTPIIAAPTLSQSSQLIFDQTQKFAQAFIDEYLGRIKRTRDTLTYIQWDTGVMLRALSANDISVRKPEGYTGSILVIDEGHRVNQNMMGIFLPMLSDAVMEGTAKVIILGVGGHKTSAIEVMKQRGYRTVRIPAEQASDMEPALIPLFEKAKRELSDWEYRMFFGCESTLEGVHAMYGMIPDRISVPEVVMRSVRPRFHFGIDVARVRDATVVHVWEVYGYGEEAFINHVDEYILENVSIPQQGRMIYEWINGRYVWRPENIVVELNGIGAGLYDCLRETPLGERIGGINTTADLKEAFWNWHARSMRNGRFGVCVLESKHEYENMVYTTREADGKLSFQHSDRWMASCMCWCSLSTIQGI